MAQKKAIQRKLGLLNLVKKKKKLLTMQRVHKTAALQQQQKTAKILQILLFRTENGSNQMCN